MKDAIQIAGALLILAAYGGAQARRLDPRSLTYLWLNLVGSAALGVPAAIDAQPGFLLLEGAWAIISVWGLATRGRTGASPRT